MPLHACGLNEDVNIKIMISTRFATAIRFILAGIIFTYANYLRLSQQSLLNGVDDNELSDR
jgi:hypothetical protein